MIIYIPIEIPVRELPGYLLFCASAKSRGHTVVMASGISLFLLLRCKALLKGCYLIKNVNIPDRSKKVYSRFIHQGFDLYCQEQESSVLFGNFKSHLDVLNIRSDQVMPFKGVFCWGQRDFKEYKKFFHEQEHIFHDVGSLRADIWSTKYIQLRASKRSEGQKPYLLFVSNFGYVMGKRHWAEESLVSRSLEHFETLSQEQTFINAIAQESKICSEMINAVKHLSQKYDQYDILIRPHPRDDIDKWKHIFCNNKNVFVTGNDDSISHWIQNACAVIQNGCTSALEATLQKVPVISFGSERIYDDLSIPNKLGMRAKSLLELEQVLENILIPQNYIQSQDKSDALLEPIVSRNGDSSSKILKIMEENSPSLMHQEITFGDMLKIKAILATKRFFDSLRRVIGVKDLDVDTFDFRDKILEQDLRIICSVLDLKEPEVTRLNKSFLLIR
ncbi:MAG: hypothetical protein CMK41_06660 [Porticoccaceae bacterium]|nr:hypothetical protein [Porticoccaceae bacterium]|tara:strand:- start:18390 stop:19727 length:1338 start_codon:yes stop_codon:yes gene_type:complete